VSEGQKPPIPISQKWFRQIYVPFVVYDRRAQVRSSRAVRSGRSPTVWAYSKWAHRRDPQRKTISLVATAHYLVRVMWATLKHATVWEERLALAKEPSAA
jgi:hypothetical protein